MIDLDRQNQSEDERRIRDDEVAKVVRWIDRNVPGGDASVKAHIINNLKRSAHRG